MALQCFALSIRRLTDHLGHRSLQKFTKFLDPKYVQIEKQKFIDIHSHFEDFINKGVAHQDEWSIADQLKAFPDTKVIDADISIIEKFYFKFSKEICTSYLNVGSNVSNFSNEIKKLV